MGNACLKKVCATYAAVYGRGGARQKGCANSRAIWTLRITVGPGRQAPGASHAPPSATSKRCPEPWVSGLKWSPIGRGFSLLPSQTKRSDMRHGALHDGAARKAPFGSGSACPHQR